MHAESFVYEAEPRFCYMRATRSACNIKLDVVLLVCLVLLFMIKIMRNGDWSWAHLCGQDHVLPRALRTIYNTNLYACILCFAIRNHKLCPKLILMLTFQSAVHLRTECLGMEPSLSCLYNLSDIAIYIHPFYLLCIIYSDPNHAMYIM